MSIPVDKPISAVSYNGTPIPIFAGRGVAVVFGDSIFDDKTDVQISNFGEYLESQHLYDTVYNFAHGGTGFGNTFKVNQGYNLYELLQKQEVRSAVAEADVIYMHLGGNDVGTQYYGALGFQYPSDIEPEYDLNGKVASCFATIYSLNPRVTIIYTPFANVGNTIQFSKKYYGGNYSDLVTLAQSETLYGMFAAFSGIQNSFYFSVMESMRAFETRDGLHPTTASGYGLYNGILYGGYKHTARYMEHAFVHISNNTIVASDSINQVAAQLFSAAAFNFDTKLIVFDDTNGIGMSIVPCFFADCDTMVWVQVANNNRTIGLNASGFFII